jgi:formate/nitrite transporter
MQTSVLKASSVRCAPSLQRSRLSSIKRAPLVIRAGAVSEVQTYTTTVSNGNGNGASAAPITVEVNVPAATPELLSPADAYMYSAKAGAKQAEMSIAKTFTMALYAGAYIAFGGFLGLAVVSNCPGIYGPNPGLGKLLFALLFPVGLTMNTLHGTELFTGNTMKLPAAIYEGKTTFGKLCHNWFWSYLGNFVGSLALVWLVVQSGVLANCTGYAIKTAMAKGTLPWMQCFLRAVMANWLVCVAVWNAGAASSLTGKVLGIWPPISAFVAIGLEHSVANMFLIPLGIALGAELTFGQFITQNLIPVTLGNIVGGLVFMGTASGYFYGSLGKKKEAKTA